MLPKTQTFEDKYKYVYWVLDKPMKFRNKYCRGCYNLYVDVIYPYIPVDLCRKCIWVEVGKDI